MVVAPQKLMNLIILMNSGIFETVPITKCDEIFTVLGFSLANINVIISILLILLHLIYYLKMQKNLRKN